MIDALIERARTRGKGRRLICCSAAASLAAVLASQASAAEPKTNARAERRAVAVVVAGSCTDKDSDGYGNPASGDCTHAQLDCNDANAAINPGATEVCNGVDDDCDGQTDEGFVLNPDATVPVFGFESRGVCESGGDPCDLRFPIPPGCNCIPNSHNFNQVIQACVDGGNIVGACDAGDPNAPGSMAFGNACAGGGTCQPVPVGVGSPCIEGQGVCRRLGTVVCMGPNAVECNAVPGAPQTASEGADTADPATDPLCFDGLDNDCDGLVDHAETACQTAERCDAFDNDNDGTNNEGFPIGDPCEVGVGACQNTGIYICNAQGGASCTVNAKPKPQLQESTCGDAIDNDCDGLTDCDDPTCQTTPTLCGQVNACTGQAAPGFDDLGDPCTVGVGACQSTGQIVCTPDLQGTMCNVQAGIPSPERVTTVGSCDDGIDNDCDGVTDQDAPQCRSSTLGVECSLVYAPPPGPEGIGEHGADCGGKHIVDWTVTGATGAVECQAVFKALDVNEEVLAVLGPVQIGERAHLASKLDSDDWKFTRRAHQGTFRYDVFAPIPMLEVTCRDEVGSATSFCTNVPYLEVIKPNGEVASASAADEISVVAAIPRIDPRTLQVLVDCVDIIPQLVPDPATQLPGGPFSGSVLVNGNNWQVVNLVVDTPTPVTESSIEDKAANTLTMTILGSGCGGHAVLVQGQPSADWIFAPPGHVTPNCYQEEAKDVGEWSVFKIDITAPQAGEVIDDGGLRPATINVQGEVCHGLEIEEVRVQGRVFSLSKPMVVDNGAGECAGDSKTVTLVFNEDVPVTDMAAVFSGMQSGRGSFDPGPNKLIAQATDVLGNTTHDSVPFVVGPAIPSDLLLREARRSLEPNARLVGEAVRSAIVTRDAATIHKAFTLVLNDTVTLDNGNRALREFYDLFVHEIALNMANCLLQPREFCCEKELEMPWWTCNPDVTFCTGPELLQTPQEFADTFNFDVTPHDGFVTIRVEIPMMRINVSANGECCTGGCGFFCIARTKLDFDGHFDLPNISLEVDITEDNILTGDGTFTLRFFPGDDQNISVCCDLDEAIQTGCGLSLFSFLTLGLIHLPAAFANGMAEIFGNFIEGNGIDLCPFVKEIGGQDGMQDKSKEVAGCREDLGPKFELGLEHVLEAVSITPDGIALSIGAKIDPTTIDPLADPVTGTLMTDAPLVEPNHPGLRSISMAIADDFWNQLLAGMTTSGKLRAAFTQVFELGRYLPVCSEIEPDPGDPMFATKMRRYARCVGMTECDDPANFDFLDRCQSCLDQFPLRTCGGDNDGAACQLDNDCPGTCDGVCQGNNVGQACQFDIGCGIGGTCVKTCNGGPTPGDSCSANADCKADCVGCASDDDETCARGACIRAARRARDSKVNSDAQIALHVRSETPPQLYLVDDPATPDLIEVKFRTPTVRAALIANRDGNNEVGGFSMGEGSCDFNQPCDSDHQCDQGDLDKLDLATVAQCSLESVGSNVDCLLWSTCLRLDIDFQIGVKNVPIGTESRPEIEFHLIGISEPPADGNVPDAGEQCGGSFEIPDLDFLNTESLRNDARKGLERSVCEDTPPFQACSLDFNGTVQILNPRLLTVSTCINGAECDLDFADYLVITGDLEATGLGTLVANKVCESLAAKITENTGTCEENDGSSEEHEKLCD